MFQDVLKLIYGRGEMHSAGTEKLIEVWKQVISITHTLKGQGPLC